MPGPQRPQRGGGPRGRGGDRGRPRRRRQFDEDEKSPMMWQPKTRLGRMVKTGEITNMSDALKTGLPLRESEIVDILLPDVADEVIDVKMVQRMTDSGRRVKFVITVAVGNSNGFVGLGQAKGKEVGMSIKRAIENAKLNIIEIRRGCGSWECRCRTPHTIPFQVTGKSGSVEVTFKPAPRGIGLATGDVAKKILKLAGVADCWGFTEGKTKTVVNYAKSVFDALMKNAETRITESEITKLGILQGSITTAPAPTMAAAAPSGPEPGAAPAPTEG
jgi:small subunit ribosomal protein S5